MFYNQCTFNIFSIPLQIYDETNRRTWHLVVLIGINVRASIKK